MTTNDGINLLFSSSNEYSQHLGVAIYSLLEHNKDVRKINIYIIENDIQEVNLQRLKDIGAQFPNCSIIFISFAKWRAKLHLNMMWEISLSAYGRLFVGSMMPPEVERVLYMDCDMVVRDSITELWNFPLGDNIAAAVQDYVPAETKLPVALEAEDPYLNSGLILIDLKKWRDQGLEEEAMCFIDDRKGMVVFHDQGVLNGILRGRWKRLPVKYNMMTIYYIYTPNQVKAYFKDKASFYANSEIEQGKKDPVILHYTPSFTSRPWVKNCLHPLRHYYWDTLALTPWKGTSPEPDKAKLRVRLANWWFRTFKPKA